MKNKNKASLIKEEQIEVDSALVGFIDLEKVFKSNVDKNEKKHLPVIQNAFNK